MLTGRTVPVVKQRVFADAWEHGGDGSAGHTWTPASAHFSVSRRREVVVMPWRRRRLHDVLVGLPDGRKPPPLAIQVERTQLAGVGTSEKEEGSDHYAVVADLRPHRLGA